MYMLDTNAVIYVIRHPDSGLSFKLESHLGNDVCISVITLAELEYGVMKSTAPDKNRMALQSVLAGIRVLAFTADAAIHFGDIMADLEGRGSRIGDRDTLIAAHARSLGYTLVTHNIREFSRVAGLHYEDWQTMN